VCISYRVLVHEGNVVTVEGGVMQEPKVPETVTTLPECTNPVMHTKLVSGLHYFMISDPDLIIIHVCFHLNQFSQYNFMISVPHMCIYNTLTPLILKHDT